VSCRETCKKTCEELVVRCQSGKPFEFCLPFGARLRYDGFRVFYDPPITIPADGDYLISVTDGCINGVIRPPDPSYQAPPCEPEPYPCPGGGDVSIDPDTRNLTILSPDGSLLTRIYVDPAGILTASGDGTAASPLRLTVPASTLDLHVTSSTPKALSVGGAGTVADPIDIAHQPSAIAESSAGSYDFDEYGHAIKYNAPDASLGVVSVSAVDGHIVAQNTNGAVLLSLPTQDYSHEQTVQAYDKTLTIDLQGRVKSITPRESYAVSERFVQSFVAGLASLEFTFTTITLGRFRLTVTGNFTGTGTGLVGLPSGYSALLDGNTLTAYFDTATKRIEAFTDYVQEAGTHTITIGLPSASSGPSILDLQLCQ
jgi:hypothetical protein